MVIAGLTSARLASAAWMTGLIPKLANAQSPCLCDTVAARTGPRRVGSHRHKGLACKRQPGSGGARGRVERPEIHTTCRRGTIRRRACSETGQHVTLPRPPAGIPRPAGLQCETVVGTPGAGDACGTFVWPGLSSTQCGDAGSRSIAAAADPNLPSAAYPIPAVRMTLLALPDLTVILTVPPRAPSPITGRFPAARRPADTWIHRFRLCRLDSLSLSCRRRSPTPGADRLRTAPAGVVGQFAGCRRIVRPSVSVAAPRTMPFRTSPP